MTAHKTAALTRIVAATCQRRQAIRELGLLLASLPPADRRCALAAVPSVWRAAVQTEIGRWCSAGQRHASHRGRAPGY